jgi:hypothetical protein
MTACVVAFGCDSRESPDGQDNGTVLLTGEGTPTDTPIRGCEAAVFGTLAPNWRKYAVVAGRLPGWAPPATRLSPRGASARATVATCFRRRLRLSEAGALVKLEVPEGERHRLSLAYGGAGPPDNLYALSEGKSSWALRACDDTETQFNGGFIVAGAQCAEVDVFVEGRNQPIRAFIPFGRRCPPSLRYGTTAALSRSRGGSASRPATSSSPTSCVIRRRHGWAPLARKASAARTVRGVWWKAPRRVSSS